MRHLIYYHIQRNNDLRDHLIFKLFRSWEKKKDMSDKLNYCHYNTLQIDEIKTFVNLYYYLHFYKCRVEHGDKENCSPRRDFIDT